MISLFISLLFVLRGSLVFFLCEHRALAKRNWPAKDKELVSFWKCAFGQRLNQSSMSKVESVDTSSTFDNEPEISSTRIPRGGWDVSTISTPSIHLGQTRL